MRLIDADRMKTTHEIQMGDFNSMESIGKWIDRQPTAYDVEAVVRELEAEYEWQADTFHGTLNDDALGQMRAYDNAIRIVKRGGRDE